MSYKEQAESLGIKVDGRWSEERIKAEIMKVQGFVAVTEPIVYDQTEKVPLNLSAMNDLARRIFDGQGSIPDIERVRRITNALKDKGYTPEEIKQLDLPIENLSKYLG